MILVTNNERFLEIKDRLEHKKIEVRLLDKDYIGVLEYVRDMVHSNYEVLTHPLYGSVKPNETLYRSVVLKEGNMLDYSSLTLVEDAIATAIKFKKNKLTPNWTEQVKDDFKLIDYDLITKTIDRIVDGF